MKNCILRVFFSITNFRFEPFTLFFHRQLHILMHLCFPRWIIWLQVPLRQFRRNASKESIKEKRKSWRCLPSYLEWDTETSLGLWGWRIGHSKITIKKQNRGKTFLSTRTKYMRSKLSIFFCQQHYVDQHRKAVTSHGVKDLKEAHSNFIQLYAFF